MILQIATIWMKIDSNFIHATNMSVMLIPLDLSLIWRERPFIRFFISKNFPRGLFDKNERPKKIEYVDRYGNSKSEQLKMFNI
jgi:hypothetical protein